MEKEQDFDNSGSTGKNGSQDSYDSFDLEFQNGMSEFVDQIMKEEALQKHIDQKKEHNSLEHNEETSFKKDDIDTLRERTNRIINQYKDTEMSMGDSTVNEEKEVAENNMKSEHELSDMEKKDDKNLDETNAKMFSPISDYNKHQKDEDMLNEISMELAKQINDEIDPNKDDNDRVNEDVVEEEKRKFPRWAKIVTSVVAVLVSLTLVFVGTPWGRKQLKKIAVSIATEYAYGKMDYDDGSNVVVQDPVEDRDVTGDTDDSLSIIWGNSGYDGYARHDDNVINILLLGEEAIGSGEGRGRTDMVMIASMNVKNHTVKLTSIMRDTLVQIPEFQGKTYLDNKLNSAYEIGGIQMLYETIAKNFDIRLDGYVLVGFDDFEKIIDAIGGVEVTLSAKEARYLNRTNYISNPSNRNVVEGTQTLNGNQALGFCRVRHVATVDDQHYDYGRTSRQRVVLNAIFDKCKKLNPTDLVLLMNDCLNYVTTDITKEQFSNYLEIGLSLNLDKMDNCRIPAEGTYTEGSVRGMSVLIPDLDRNISVLHNFIFGDPLPEGVEEGTIKDGLDRIKAKEEEEARKEEEARQQQMLENQNSTNTNGTNSTNTMNNTSSYNGTSSSNGTGNSGTISSGTSSSGSTW